MRRIIAVVLLYALAAAAAAQDRFFESGGARIRYVDVGAGAPVVLIHGFTGTIERGVPRHPAFLAAIRRRIAQ